jgi:hypothetical protein
MMFSNGGVIPDIQGWSLLICIPRLGYPAVGRDGNEDKS